MNFDSLNLQLFAVQTTGDLSDEMKTYYEERLIDLAEPRLVHDQFGDQISYSAQWWQGD